MKTKSNLFQAGLWVGVLGMLCPVFPGQAHEQYELPTADGPPSKLAEAIPWSQLGAKAGANSKGEGLTVSLTEGGARLHCAFQRLNGEATSEGLWLASTVPNQPNDRFRVTAVAVGPESRVGSPLPAVGVASIPASRFLSCLVPPADCGAHGVTRPTPLPATGEVSVDGETARFRRPGLIEEYTVSMDGVRQDFVVLEKPRGASVPASRLASSLAPPTESQLRVELAVIGARVEPIGGGAQLVLEKSGRKIAYSRLRVTDATGKELTARIDVAASRQSAAEMKQEDGGGLPTRRYACLALIVDDAQAVYPIRIDPTFSDANWISLGGIPGANGDVLEAVVGSGTLYICGYFSVVGDVLANRIAKWDGSSWSALGSGMSNPVYALAVSGSDLYAAGQFTTAGGIPATNIAKWNGSSWSALGSGMDGGVVALAVSGSDLYAGGWFTTAGGIPANYIAKWNGSSWSALGSGMNGMVRALAVSGSDVYAGGSFTTAGGSAATNIAKWNGSSWSALGLRMNYGYVLALAVSGSDLYAGGYFTAADGVIANVAKWNGSSWSALGSGISLPGDGGVQALAVSGNDLYAGGQFTTAGGIPATNIAKWNGSSWSGLGSGMNQHGYVLALAVSGSDLYAGGSFTAPGGSAATHIAKWNGSSWGGLGSGMNSLNAYVHALEVSGSDVYAGGSFTTAGGVIANCVAKWNGSSWSPLALEPGMNHSVFALAVSSSDLYAGGYFTTAGGVAANHIAKWNGSGWSALGSGVSGPPYYPFYGGTVSALTVLGSDVYAGGAFTAAGGIPATGIAKWNGSSWSALGSGVSGLPDYPVYPFYGGIVSALAVLGSDLYAGGAFTSAGGIAATNIAKWNGSSWSALGSGMNQFGSVYALAVSGNDLYAGGSFTTAGGSPASYIAKWNGSSWSALGSGLNGFVWALEVSGSDVYAGGAFTMAGGVAANHIAKWNGSAWSALGSGMNGRVYALALSGSDVHAGGEFTTAGGKVSTYVARAVLGDAPGYNQLTGTSLSEDAMQFSYVGYPATNYALDRAFNLSPPISWVGQETNTMTVSGVLMFTNTPAPGTNNFWRVRSVP